MNGIVYLYTRIAATTITKMVEHRFWNGTCVEIKCKLVMILLSMRGYTCTFIPAFVHILTGLNAVIVFLPTHKTCKSSPWLYDRFFFQKVKAPCFIQRMAPPIFEKSSSHMITKDFKLFWLVPFYPMKHFSVASKKNIKLVTFLTGFCGKQITAVHCIIFLMYYSPVLWVLFNKRMFLLQLKYMANKPVKSLLSELLWCVESRYN